MAFAAPAVAAPRMVAASESAGNPAFAGGEVIYAAPVASRGTELRAVAADGSTRLVHTFRVAAAHPNPWDEGFGDFASLLIELRGSPEGLAARVLTHWGDRYFSHERSEIVSGQAAGGLAGVASHCNQNYVAVTPSIDVDGSRLAYVREICSRGTSRQVVVRDIRTGTETTGPATATREVRLAGRYLAYRPADRPTTVDVYDLERAQVVKTVLEAGVRFDVQADGKVADGPGPYGSCQGGVRWRSLAEETPHTVAGCEWGLTAIDGDHIALSRLTQPGAVAVVALDGQARVIDLPGPLAQEPDLQGNRIAFATSGCSTDTGGVWVDDGTGSPAPRASLTECSVRLPKSTLRVARNGTVRVPVSCPTGCRGAIHIRGGRRYQEEFNFADDMFEVAARGKLSVPVSVGLLRKRYGRRTLHVRVEVRINQRVNQYRYVRVVRNLKMQV